MFVDLDPTIRSTPSCSDQRSARTLYLLGQIMRAVAACIGGPGPGPAPPSTDCRQRSWAWRNSSSGEKAHRRYHVPRTSTSMTPDHMSRCRRRTPRARRASDGRRIASRQQHRVIPRGCGRLLPHRPGLSTAAEAGQAAADRRYMDMESRHLELGDPETESRDVVAPTIEPSPGDPGARSRPTVAWRRDGTLGAEGGATGIGIIQRGGSAADAHPQSTGSK